MKRFSIVAAIVVVAVLVVVPVAFAGARPIGIATPDNAYTPTSTCEGCHSLIASPTDPYAQYIQTAHYASVENPLVTEENPTNCGGCHSANLDPSVALAMPANQELPTDADNPTETRVACASCHFGFNATHVGATTPTAYGQFADPDVCGQCHDRQSTSVAQYMAIPYDSDGNPTGPAAPTTLRFVPAYNPFTMPLLYNADTQPDGLMNIGSGMATWPGGYSAYAHEFNAVQYNEMSEGWYLGTIPAPFDTPITHFNSWTMLNTFVPDAAPGEPGVTANEKINFCAHCMSADQRILVQAGKLTVHPDSVQTTPTDSAGNPVTKDQIKFGDTCVACHDPHAKGPNTSVWNKDRNPQLIQTTTNVEGVEEPVTRATLCGTCHNGELAEGQTSFAPGAEINHPTNEFMNGIGAIDVPKTPALHKGMCVQCHMVPTGYTREGLPATGGNHIFTPIMPVTAMTQTTETANPNFDDTLPPDPVTNPETITQHMPYSACSTCHAGTNGDDYAKTEAMQQIIDQRQAWTHDMVDEVMATLNAKAVDFGYADAATAIADAAFVAANVDFGKAWTNVQLVSNEGSWGVHNWQYGVAVLNTAMEEADAARIAVAGVTITPSAAKVTYGSTLKLSGTVTIPAGGPALVGGDQVRLWVNGAATRFATLSGSSYTFTGVQPNKNTKYTIQFVGDANYAPTVGDSTNVNVSYRVTINVSQTSVAAGAKLTVSGSVGPTAGPVTIQRYTNGAWKTFKSGVSVNSKSRYSYTFTTKKGTYKLRTMKAASANVVQGVSGYKTVTAK